MSDTGIDWIGRSRYINLNVRNFIEGRWSTVGGAMLDKYSPRDGTLLYHLGTGEAAEVDAAVAVARRAFDDGRWSRLSLQRRKDILFKLASLVEGHLDELALLECLDVGKPIRDALTFDVPAAAATIRFCAEAADKLYGKVYAADRSSLSYQLRRPVGVVAGIVGWNFPLLLAAAKIGPALATGNSLVLKPSEFTSFSASRLAELAVEAGVPEGVLNVIHGGRELGAALAHHSDVDLITFTGSSLTGKKLLIAAGASNMKQVILECGGKAPSIVFDDCPDLDAVADGIAARAFWNQGQVCTASSRLLVQDGIKDELQRRVIERAAALRPGDPLVPETTFGALVNLEHQNKVLAYVDAGEREGARKVFQSDCPSPHKGGFYVPPVVFDQVSSAQKIAQEEIFGPVLSILSFRDEAEAIRIANDTIYGLSTILWTEDLGRAHRVAQQIDSGWIVVNATADPIGGPVVGGLPTGGHKQSGIGVEGGLEGLDAYMTRTAVQMFV